MSASLRGGRRYVFTFMLGGIVSSELAWIIRTENKQRDLNRRTQAEITISRNIVDRLKKGEKVDVEKELLGSNDHEEQDLNSILENLEDVDSRWGEARAGGSNIFKQSPERKPEPSLPKSEPPKPSKGGWL